MTSSSNRPHGHDLLFIGGLHKSGTSLFHRCIKSHSRVSGFSDTGVPRDEGQLLQSVFPPANQSGGMGRFGFHDESHLTETSPLVDTPNRSRLLQEWGRHWDLDKSVLVEKSPPTLIRARFLQALFPEAKFVIIVRHPLPVCYSTSKWTDIPLHRLVGHWIHCHEIFERDRPHIRRLLLIRYEDLVLRPRATLQQVFNFAGLDLKMPDEEIDSGINRKYLRRWTYLKLLPRGYRYQQRIIERYGPAVAPFEYGYRLDEEVWY